MQTIDLSRSLKGADLITELPTPMYKPVLEVLGNSQAEQTFEQKILRYELSKKLLYGQGKCEATEAEIEALREELPRLVTFVMGQIVDALKQN